MFASHSALGRIRT